MPGPATTKAREYKRIVETSTQRVAKAGATALAKSVRAALKTDTGGNNALSGVPSARLSVKVGPPVGNTTAKVTVEAGPRKALGVWSWLENGTRRHPLGAGKRRGQKMKMPDGRWATGPFRGGGSRAKHTWTRGVEGAIDDANAAMAEEWGRDA